MDLLITTGGVSVGDFDLLPDIYQKIGADVLFNKVAMRPGSVTTVAVYNDKFLFGLSGNPSASYVGFELFARPIIRTMLFSEYPHLRKETAQLAEDFLKPNPFSRLLRTRLFYESGQLKVIPSGVDKSNITTSLAGANSLTVLPGGHVVSKRETSWTSCSSMTRKVPNGLGEALYFSGGWLPK